MNKIILLMVCIFLMLIHSAAFASVIDAPHNESNQISCSTCHKYSLWWQYSPVYGDEQEYEKRTNDICMQCHGSEGSAPYVDFHSSQGTGSQHRDEIGPWSRPCISCHDPHMQPQLGWLEINPSLKDTLFLIRGTIKPGSLIVGSNTTTFDFTNLIINSSDWSDPTLWNKKTGKGRGLILTVSAETAENSFEILEASSGVSGQGQIVVQGVIDEPYSGGSFGIIYGQLIRDSIKGVEGDKDIKFFNPKGDFVDTENGEGLCQICHSKTNHFQYNGEAPDQNHSNIFEADKQRCTRCHQHNSGFGHGGNGGSQCADCHNTNKHPVHLQAGAMCSDCHGTGPVRDGHGEVILDPHTAETCSACHQDGRGGAPNDPSYRYNWEDPTYQVSCDSCHSGRAFLDEQVMSTNGHNRLVGEDWIRNFPCTYCHSATVDDVWKLSDKHVNGQVDVSIHSQWAVVGEPAPTYDPNTKVCANTYCHSDGTTVDPDMRPYAWNGGHRDCNACHGHDQDNNECIQCHDDNRSFPDEQKWMSAMPMYQNTGPGTERANSHPRHIFTGFSCDECHVKTTKGSCLECHGTVVPSGKMSESQHIDPQYHINREKTVAFKQGGSYNPVTKRCSNTACHTGGVEPTWGGSVNDAVVCYECHLTTKPDKDDFVAMNGVRARINLKQWETSGHGRPFSAGNYPVSDNPAANFPEKGCWYCHDNQVIHNTEDNPFRLRKHDQFSKRFDKECVFCHMIGQDNECLQCHNSSKSLAPQLEDITVENHGQYVDGQTSCVTVCHQDDSSRHKTGAGVWDQSQKDDVRNSYIMMGVCLKCHDDDSGGQCNSCHTGSQYVLGFNPGLPGTGFITATTAMASSVHFGYKHYAQLEATGKWKGGKFCWDCHDPHGDENIYMIHDKVAKETDGVFGIPLDRAEVVFTEKQSGLDYARSTAPYDGICNVCHTDPDQHYRSDGGDNHNAGRICTSCHEHRFTDSHSSKQACNTCHENRPMPRHTAFGLPWDCTKCHRGSIGKRMDIIGQFKANSHHVQGVEISNKHCYACHWEATEQGLINIEYHSGYNYKTHESVKNQEVNLVIWGPGERPTDYDDGVSATTFLPSNLATGGSQERAEIESITPHCLGCHSAQNKETQPFNDCRTPIQYAWDGLSIKERYGNKGTTTWGKYTTAPGAAKKDLQKAFSAHGNAVGNEGGFNPETGIDGEITNTRNGSYNIQCFDCHSSHGSKVSGVTSSYVTFNGTKNGANLKETQAGKGGYTTTYFASAYPDPNSVNPYNAGAGQCFDCHETATSGSTPWGYNSTFGASQPIIGYKDNNRFSGSEPAGRFAYRAEKATLGGHFNASSPLTNEPMGTIDGLCTPCHDPHGVSPTIGEKMIYAVPMLKGTWLTSPYKEDYPNTRQGSREYRKGDYHWQTDRTAFNGERIYQDDTEFAGLCLRCHPKENLTDGINKNTDFKSLDRVHESVKGWGSNAEHSYSCSKCHQPHASGLPRLLQTNCLDYKHQGLVVSGGMYKMSSRMANQMYPRSNTGLTCHDSESAAGGKWYEQKWNNVSPW